jgi:hypothetical protein
MASVGPLESRCSRDHSTAWKLFSDTGVQGTVPWRVVCRYCMRCVESGVSENNAAFKAVIQEWSRTTKKKRKKKDK